MANSITPLLIPYEPEQFWKEIRKVIREEISKLDYKNQSETPIMEMPGLTFKPLYTMTEICKIFQISKPTVYEWIEHGILKPIKIKTRVYFLHQDIQRLISTGGNAK